MRQEGLASELVSAPSLSVQQEAKQHGWETVEGIPARGYGNWVILKKIGSFSEMMIWGLRGYYSTNTQHQYYKPYHTRCWETKLDNNIWFKQLKKKKHHTKRENDNSKIIPD